MGRRIGALLEWKSSRTGLRGGSQPIVVRDGANELHLDLLGHELGGKLSLELVVVLLKAGGSPVGFAPRLPGSILWKEATAVTLEGDADRFPIELRSFKAGGVRGSSPFRNSFSPQICTTSGSDSCQS